MKTLYTAEALATGEGRTATAAPPTARLISTWRTEGDGWQRQRHQPRAAVRHRLRRLLPFGAAAGRPQEKADVEDSAVGTRVSLGQLDNGGFGLAVELEVTLPNMVTTPRRRLDREGPPGVPLLERHPRQHRRHARRHRRLSHSETAGRSRFQPLNSKAQIRDLPEFRHQHQPVLRERRRPAR